MRSNYVGFLAAWVMLAFACPGRELTVRDRGAALVVSTEKARATVVVFVSSVCPISNSYVERLNDLYRSWSGRGVQFVFVNANANERQEQIDEHAKANELAFPVYTDSGGRLAGQLQAQMTPEVFVFDAPGTLRYHGRIDDSVNPARVRSHDLRDTLEALEAGRLDAKLRETRAFGCTIKRGRL